MPTITIASYTGTFTIAGEEVVRIPLSKDLYYHGCQECADFSIAFGGGVYFVRNEDRIIRMRYEEDFEEVKSLFVTHFNENHKDIVEKREKDTRIYKKYEPDEPYTVVSNGTHTVHISNQLIGRSVFSDYYIGAQAVVDDIILTNEGLERISNVCGVPLIGSAPVIYPTNYPRPSVNPNNLDRNARFRAGLR